MSWSKLVVDSPSGTKLLLQRLAASPLVRKSLPNAAAICQQYFAFKRQPHETIGSFLVRETLVQEEFTEALIRLHEEKLGLSQDQRDFGLPPEEEWEDEAWAGASWGWWEDEETYGETGDGGAEPGHGDEDAAPESDSRLPEGQAPDVSGPPGATGSSPSNRGAGSQRQGVVFLPAGRPDGPAPLEAIVPLLLSR